MILEIICFLLFFLCLTAAVRILQGVRTMAVLDEILAAQASIATAIQTIADQKAASLTPEQAQQVLANETTNLASITAIITP